MESHRRRARVMVIDDSLTVRHIIEHSLLREGYAVDSFPDGPSAMQAMTNGQVDIPDLVFLDIGLPEMDGYTVARLFQSKDELSKTVIIMISGLNGMFNRVRGRMSGAKAYIAKPFKPGDVIKAAHTFIGPPLLVVA